MLFSHIWKIEKIGSLSASLTQNDNSVGGGLNQPTRVFELLWPQFPTNQSKHGLKWKFGYLHTFRNFEKNPGFCSFAVGLHQRELVWPWKISSFGTTIFKNSQFFIYIDNIYIKWKLKTF